MLARDWRMTGHPCCAHTVLPTRHTITDATLSSDVRDASNVYAVSASGAMAWGTSHTQLHLVV